MFELVTDVIDVDTRLQTLQNPTSGGYVSFEGWVRNHNEGKPVQKLEYEAYETLALAEGNRIIDEAIGRFEIEGVHCVHRLGELAIGDIAVWVGVSAAHRDAAFTACRYVIDEIKARLPIWKKEHYTEGPATWVNCQACAAHGHHHGLEISERDFYTRQMCLPDVGESGQQRLKKARVLVVGAGGLGCSALLYLTSAGIGTIGICDHDVLQTDNLHRQVLFQAADVGQLKAQRAADHLAKLNPFTRFDVVNEAVSADNVERLFSQYDWVVDCTDNFRTKFLLNDAAVLLQTPLVQSSIYQYEGQLQRWRPEDDSACLRCHWESVPDEGCVGTCEEAGVLGSIPGVFGSLQALEVVKGVLDIETPLSNHMLLMDLRSYQVMPVRRARKAECPVCGDAPSITELSSTHYLPAVSALEVDVASLEPAELHTYEWVDVRGLEHLPPLKKDTCYLLYCHRGIKSLEMVKLLREQGYAQTYSVAGGYASVQQASACLNEVALS